MANGSTRRLLGAALLSLCLISPAASQGSPAKNKEAGNEQIIVTEDPAKQPRARG